jgi:hypothetical protein
MPKPALRAIRNVWRLNPGLRVRQVLQKFLCQNVPRGTGGSGIIRSELIAENGSIRASADYCSRLLGSRRRAALDGFERFEDSYALTEEFREWLVSLKPTLK